MFIKFISQLALSVLLLAGLAANVVFAQTTAFTYQGKLTDTGTPQASYQMEFRLFGSPGGADQICGAITNPNVTVNQGVFTVNLNFPCAEAFPGADRFLQIAVRRNAGESFVTLNPRQQITSSPYSIRTLSAAQADLALNSQQLGGVNASEYVTTTSAGNSFIRNSMTQQTADFNVSGDGIIGGNFGVGATPQAGFRFDVPADARFRTANGNINFGTPAAQTGMSIISTNFGPNRADIRFDGVTLKLLAGIGAGAMPDTNGINVDTLGNVGIGITPGFGFPLEISGAVRSVGDSTRFVAQTIGGTNSSARFYMRSNNRSWFIGTSQNFNGDQFHLFDDTSGQFRMTVQPAGGAISFPLGNVGIGTTTPNTQLTLNGGTPWTSAGWTASMNLQNASALGWEANSSGQRFGIGQSNGGLYFFRTISGFGSTLTPANYDMQITDTGNIIQPIDNNGLVKAMIVVNEGGTITRCYNGVTNSSNGNCGFTVTTPLDGVYRINYGFDISNRFFSVSCEYGNGTFGPNRPNNGANYRIFGTNSLEIFTFIANNGQDTSAINGFTVIVF